jgi:hypothetical protein
MKGNQWVDQYSQWIEYVQQNLKSDGYTKVAAHIGVTHEALVRQVCTWRKKGIKMPDMRGCCGRKATKIPRIPGIRGKKAAPDGTINEKTVKGLVYLYKKVDGKWVCQGSKEGQEDKKKAPGRKKGSGKPKVVKVRKPKKVKPLKQLKPVVYKPLKTPEKVLPTLVRNVQEYKSVRINDKIIIQVKKEVPDEEAREKYMRKLQEMEALRYKPSTSKQRKYGV